MRFRFYALNAFLQEPVPVYETTQAALGAALAEHEGEHVIYLAADVNITDLSQDVKVRLTRSMARGSCIGL